MTDITKEQIFDRLKQHNVVSVEADYDGYADSGCIESIIAVANDGSKVDLDEKLHDNLEEYICDRLPEGWEINDGSYGTVRFDVATDAVCFSHNDRFTQEHLTEW